MMTTETATVVINGVEYELPTQFEFVVCQGITVTLHRPAVVREVEGSIEQQEEGKQSRTPAYIHARGLSLTREG